MLPLRAKSPWRAYLDLDFRVTTRTSLSCLSRQVASEPSPKIFWPSIANEQSRPGDTRALG